MRVWLPFWLFVVVSWLAVGFYSFIAGSSDCHVSGTCAADRTVAGFAVLLIPAQALLAAYLKHRRSD
jgi:hypothetical protein